MAYGVWRWEGLGRSAEGVPSVEACTVCRAGPNWGLEPSLLWGLVYLSREFEPGKHLS